MPLAWAKGRERIACLADIEEHGEVRIFDLDPNSEWLESFTLGGFCTDDVTQVASDSCTTQQQGYGYASAQAQQAARAFSDSGRWFAFAAVHESNAFLYASNLEQTPDQLGSHYTFKLLEATRPVTRLSFSPDERFLLFQHGAALELHVLATTITSHHLSDKLSVDPLCSEDFPSAPDQYCGNTERAAAFRWAPDTTALAFRAEGSVSVVNVTSDPPTDERKLPAPNCDEECTNGFAFQP